MISSSRTDLISRSSKLQMYPDVWMGSCFLNKQITLTKNNINVSAVQVGASTSGILSGDSPLGLSF